MNQHRESMKATESFVDQLDEETRAFLNIFSVRIFTWGNGTICPMIRDGNMDYPLWLPTPKECPYPRTSLEYWREVVRTGIRMNVIVPRN